MSDEVLQLRGRISDSEKITINLGDVDLGRIDLLVQEGFFSNQTDFIRTAIRNQLSSQAEEVSRSIDRHTLELGLREFGVADLEAAKAAGERLHVKVVWPRADRCGRNARARARDDRLPHGAGGAPGQPGGKSRLGGKDHRSRLGGRNRRCGSGKKGL